jgi:uncharacterized membrane protein YgcG
MVIAALATFASLLAAWIAAPSAERRITDAAPAAPAAPRPELVVEGP